MYVLYVCTCVSIEHLPCAHACLCTFCIPRATPKRMRRCAAIRRRRRTGRGKCRPQAGRGGQDVSALMGVLKLMDFAWQIAAVLLGKGGFCATEGHARTATRTRGLCKLLRSCPHGGAHARKGYISCIDLARTHSRTQELYYLYRPYSHTHARAT